MELIDSFALNDNLAPRTITTYKGAYKLYPLDPTLSEEELIQSIKLIKLSDAVILCNVLKKMRKLLGLDIDRLNFYSITVKTDYRISLRKKNIEVSKTLPSHQELLDFCDQCYEECIRSNFNVVSMKKFLINRLLITTYCRSSDLILQIGAVVKNGNYLISTPDGVVFYRSAYKTFSTYGAKTALLHDERLQKCVDMFGSGPLVNNITAVKFHTYKRIGQSKYFKIYAKDLIKNNDIQKLNEISVLRGTSISEILQSYDLGNTV